MANTKYTVYVFEQIERFETIIEYAEVKSKKIEDGKYVLEGSSDTIESLVKKFANGVIAITSDIEGNSCAIVKINSYATISVNDATRDEVILFVSRLIKARVPEWALLYLMGYDEKCDDISFYTNT